MIVVTGARGFLGRYCVRELKKLGRRLFLTTSDHACLAKGTEDHYHYLNLEEPDSFSSLPDEIDTVLHLAAAIPKKNEVITFSRYMNINASGVKLLLEKASSCGCKKFIFASTQMVIEKSFYVPVDEVHPVVPISDYGLSKTVGERYCSSHALSENMSVISLRFSQIYGAGENPGYVLTTFIDRALNKQPLVINGKGMIRRDLLYVKDAVRALLCAMQSHCSGIFNAGSGTGTSVRELAETISAVFSDGLAPVEFNNEAREEGENIIMNIEKTKRDLGFSPQFSLEKGLMDYNSELLKTRVL